MNEICKKFRDISSKNATNFVNNRAGWYVGYPWLYYENPGEKVVDGSDIKMKMALDEDLAKKAKYGGYRYEMDFKLLKYTLEGEYLGMEDL